MAYSKMQKKLTAMVYSKKKLNKAAVKAYNNFKEIEKTLNKDTSKRGKNLYKNAKN